MWRRYLREQISSLWLQFWLQKRQGRNVNMRCVKFLSSKSILQFFLKFFFLESRYQTDRTNRTHKISQTRYPRTQGATLRMVGAVGRTFPRGLWNGFSTRDPRRLREPDPISITPIKMRPVLQLRPNERSVIINVNDKKNCYLSGRDLRVREHGDTIARVRQECRLWQSRYYREPHVQSDTAL